MNQEIKPGTLLADKTMPELTGLVIRIKEEDPNPYKILCEGKILECDIDHILKYCEVIGDG